MHTRRSRFLSSKSRTRTILRVHARASGFSLPTPIPTRRGASLREATQLRSVIGPSALKAVRDLDSARKLQEQAERETERTAGILDRIRAKKEAARMSRKAA